MTLPTCSACGRPFADRRDLLVISVGRGGMVPVHPGCRREYIRRLPWLLRGTGTINRPTVLLWYLGFNLLFAGWWAVALPEHRTGVVFAWGVANLFLLAQRFLSWWSYERHLPPGP